MAASKPTFQLSEGGASFRLTLSQVLKDLNLSSGHSHNGLLAYPVEPDYHRLQ